MGFDEDEAKNGKEYSETENFIHGLVLGYTSLAFR